MASSARRGFFGRLLTLTDRLQAVGGKDLADLVVILLVSIVATGAALWLGGTIPGRYVENLTYDLRLALGAPAAQRDFAIVKVDDAAVEAMSKTSACHCLAPIDKAWLGDLIATLDAKGVRAIAVDYLLDTWSSPGEFQDFERRIAGVKAPIVAVVDPARTPGVDFPVSKKVMYADARALIHVDYDDVVRRYDPMPSRYQALATRVATATTGMKPPREPFDLRYRRPDPRVSAENAGAISPSYSAAFAAFVPERLLKGKIAFIGSVTRSATQDSDTPKEDMHATPLRFWPGHTQGTPGVEVHLHALSQILAGDKVLRAGAIWDGLTVLAAAIAGAMLGRSTQRWWVSLGIVLAGAAALLIGASAVYAYGSLMLPTTTPLLSFAFGFFILSRLAAAELQTQRAFYSSTLERYLAPQVIDRMVDGREEVKIGAEEREITVMITDLENFSHLVATLPLDTFSEVINAYFDGVIDILWKHEAMIDKMTGDGIIAIFGAPVASTDHADRALACAREIDLYALEIRERMIGRGIKFGYTRMGLSSGVGLVGNFGGERRFNYTAYGEVVVVAARLEAANKTFGTRILFSGDT
ncbi:MAG TPA: adenylate/guanylate cyclase domain-containing protein, partial [Phenylobacterium sp.]